MCEIRIGTSGYHYKHWQGPFYPLRISASQMLDFYTTHFDTVELNNSFYRLPTTDAFEAWRCSTPANFVFAVKVSRFLTHNKKLKDPQPALANFLPRVRLLGSKLGPMLFQLPPRWKVNYKRLEELLEALPPGFRYVFELRDQSWISHEITELLARYRAGFCIYELAGYRSPIMVTADFSYVRLHGPAAHKYQGCYDAAALRKWQRQVEEWGKCLKAVYVYFDNDQSGYAALNAFSLKRMIFGNGAYRCA